MADLVMIRAGLSLDRPAAESWIRMERAKGSQLDVNRSTVSRLEQFKFYNVYRAYLNGGPWAPLALHPDESWHCEPIAQAVDTDDDEWIRAHPEYGWRFVVRSEKWHAQWYQRWDMYYGQPISPLAIKDFGMFEKLIGINNKVYALGFGKIKHLNGPEQLTDVVNTTGMKEQWLTDNRRVEAFTNLLDYYAIEPGTVNNDGLVRDPFTGDYAQGNAWSEERATRAELRKLTK